MAGDAAQFPMFVFFLIKTFPFSCTFASCEQGPEVPFCGKSGSGDSGGRGCIYFQMLQGWSALISSHALAGMRGHCGEDAASAGSKIEECLMHREG